MERNYIKVEDCANLVSFSKLENLHPSFLLLDIDWQKGNLDGGSLVRFPEHLGSWETWPLELAAENVREILHFLNVMIEL